MLRPWPEWPEHFPRSCYWAFNVLFLYYIGRDFGCNNWWSCRWQKNLKKNVLIYHKIANSALSDFHIRVNDAAIELAFGQPGLLRKGNRGEMLEKAHRKVADDEYWFKKGKSQSKVYGSSDDIESAFTPKQPKLNQQMREERIKELEEDLAEACSHITFKDNWCSQAEMARNY